MRWGIERLREAWESVEGQYSDAQRDFVQDVLGEDLPEYVQSNVYMLCATTAEDSLNHWQNSKAQGYAISLLTVLPLRPDVSGTTDWSPSQITADDWRVIPGWWDVVYDENDQRGLAAAMVDFLAREAPVGAVPGLPVRLARQCAATLACIFKRHAFSVECEVRLICSDVSGGRAVHWRPGPRGPGPYLRLASLDWDRQKEDVLATPQPEARLPIQDVLAGPTPEGDRETVMATLKRLLQAQGHSAVQVACSKTPYRY